MTRWLAALIGLLVVMAIGAFLIAPTYFTRHPWILPLFAIVGALGGLRRHQTRWRPRPNPPGCSVSAARNCGNHLDVVIPE